MFYFFLFNWLEGETEKSIAKIIVSRYFVHKKVMLINWLLNYCSYFLKWAAGQQKPVEKESLFWRQ